MLGQSTLISYHTEANGYIFFATGVEVQQILVHTPQIVVIKFRVHPFCRSKDVFWM